MGTQDDKRTFVYRIDGSDRVAFVDEEWLRFAAENGAEELSRERVLGASIHTFIADQETSAIYHFLLGKVRATGTALEVPFRCDSPECRRQMTMEVAPFGEELVEIRSRLIKREPREPIALLDAGVDRSDELVRMCGWCKKIELPAQEWVEVEEGVRALALLEAQRPPGLTHGICPSCRDHLYRTEPALKYLRQRPGRS